MSDRCPAPACGATDGDHLCVKRRGHPVQDPVPSWNWGGLPHRCACGHRWTDPLTKENHDG